MELPNYGYQQVALFSKSGREEVISFIKSAVVTGKKEYVFWGHNLAPVPSNHHSVCLSGRTGRHC